MTRQLDNVFAYRDYRQLLGDLFLARKRQGKYSYRKFSEEAGLSSPNYLKLVVDGSRNLSLEKAMEFAQVFGLNREETSFFGLLVRFGNAKDSEERSQLFHLIEHHRKADSTLDNLDAYEAFFSHWAYPVISLLLNFPDIDQDPKKIARYLQPSIPVAEARKALDVLLELGYVRQEGGRLVPSDRTLETPLEIRQVWMRQYHARVLERAIAALDEVPKEQRNVSTFAVSLPDSKVPEFLAHVHRLRKELFHYAQELSENTDEPDTHIYQLGIQAFPVASVDDS